MMRLLILQMCGVQLLAANHMLPADVVPLHYDLHYVFDVDPATNFSFYAVVEIALKVIQSTSTIILHADELSISYDNITLESNDVQAPSVVSQDTHKDYNFLKLLLDGRLETDHNYILTIPFSSNVEPGLDGIYLSSYVDSKTNKTEYLITTQYEAISARKGFPCFDEPMLKATFQITIGHNRDFNAISNMPVQSSSNDNSLEKFWPWQDIAKSFKKSISQFVWDRFERSVPMSTYLVALVVSKFQITESPAGLSNTKFRTFARKDAIAQTKYASVIGPKILSFYEKFFDIPYPLPKQDLIAIPDFAAGAMENWGLITYRETALLYDPEKSSMTNKEKVARVVAHELAHQWFGNLVTMKWWSDLWLNEGFATYMAELGVDAVEPKWKVKLGNSLLDILDVLELDALESSHPILASVNDPKRIDETFDTISYEKGSTIIRMMSMYLGEEVFKTAIHNYLEKYAYQNAEQDDLWQELTDVSKNHNVLPQGVSVKDIMDTWTTQTGFPIVKAERNYEKNTVAISQSRFFSLKDKSSSASWWVPLTILGKGQKQQSMQWISNTQGIKGQAHEIAVDVKQNDWLLFNPDMIAPVRVLYDARNWHLLAMALRSRAGLREVPVPARVQLIDDACKFAAGDLLDYELTLQIVSYLRQEREYVPLKTGLKCLSKVNSLLKRQPNYGIFQKYVNTIVADTFCKGGGLTKWNTKNSDNINSVKMQVITSTWACRMKVPNCEDDAIDLYQRWMQSASPDTNNPIPLNLRPMVYCVAISRGGGAHWRWALERRRKTNVVSMQSSLLEALSCTRETWLLRTLLDWTIADDSEIRKQDTMSTIINVVRSENGYYLAKDFLYQHIEDLDKALQGQDRHLGWIFKALLSQFTTQRELDEFEAWFQNNKGYFEKTMSSIEQGREIAKVNIEWMNKHSQNVIEIMKNLVQIHKTTLRSI